MRKISGSSASATYYTLLAGAAIVTNTTNRYTVFPDAPVGTNVSATGVLAVDRH